MDAAESVLNTSHSEIVTYNKIRALFSSVIIARNMIYVFFTHPVILFVSISGYSHVICRPESVPKNLFNVNQLSDI